MQQVLNAYFGIYHFVAKNRIKEKDLQERHIHTHLVCVISTGLLMWGYALLAQLTINNSIPMYVGYTCSIIHLLSPLLYRVSNNHFLNSNVFIGAGMIHQACFAYFTGGFDSDLLIWFGILPMLAGVVSGKKGVIFWATTTSIGVIYFFGKKIYGPPFPNLISENGKTIAHLLLTFGWIFLSTIIIWVYLLLEEINTVKMENQNQSIQNLVYILAHDISNYLTIILGRVKSIEKKMFVNDKSQLIEMPIVEKVNLKKAYNAAKTINVIVNNVKELYATELGKKDIELEIVNVSHVFLELKENFQERLELKNIKLKIIIPTDKINFRSNRTLMTHQILGNLLSNAIKFSQNNSEIILEAGIFDKKLQIKVIDSGVGIPQSIRHKLFDLKAITSRIGTNGEEGNGFGLPIVRANVEKLGGRIFIDNESISGTSFILEFSLIE